MIQRAFGFLLAFVPTLASAGLITEKPWGLLVSTEFERNQGLTATTQDLLQNWSITPRYHFGEDQEHTFKITLPFGYSLTQKVTLFLYDVQFRYEKRNLFAPWGDTFFDGGVWIYGPVSRVSRDDSVFVSGKTWLKWYGTWASSILNWYTQIDFRYWWNQYSSPDPQSTHPQQRSGIHEIPKFLRNSLLNDRFAGQINGGLILSVGHLAPTTPVLKNLWLSLDVHGRWAHTYSVRNPPLAADTYHTLLIYQGLAWKVIENIFLDFTIQHSGRIKGAQKIQPFGRWTSYYLGINIEV